MENNSTAKIITFSIICANYNHTEFIEESIESVINQTYPYWELIIVDDASTDNSIEKIIPYLKDKRIKLIVHEINMGAGRTLREAANSAKNLILAMLDPDDKLHKNALEIMAKAYRENPEYGFIYSTNWVCDSKLKKKKISKFAGNVDPYKSNLNERKTSHFKTCRRDLYEKTEGFNPDLKMCLDGDFCFKMEEITRLKFINIPLYYYRKYEGGVSIKYLYQVALENYIAKLNAYYRRLNTNIPNLSYEEITLEYYKVVFFKLVQFLIFLKKFFKINKISDTTIKKTYYLPNDIKCKFNRLKNKYFYWF